ncbi:MAG TPA: hypothetical protein VFP72_20690 [Kineosporiaceae bacterium]|nr:hypothetical protein [Kineosporiaceae bacterium]
MHPLEEAPRTGSRKAATRPPMPWLPLPGEDPGFTLARAFALVCAAVAVLDLLRVTGPPSWAAVALVVAACVTGARPVAAAGAGAISWALQTGFGVHRFALLTFSAADLGRLAALVTLGVLVALLARHGRDRRRQQAR